MKRVHLIAADPVSREELGLRVFEVKRHTLSKSTFSILPSKRRLCQSSVCRLMRAYRACKEIAAYVSGGAWLQQGARVCEYIKGPSQGTNLSIPHWPSFLAVAGSTFQCSIVKRPGLSRNKMSKTDVHNMPSSSLRTRTKRLADASMCFQFSGQSTFHKLVGRLRADRFVA